VSGIDTVLGALPDSKPSGKDRWRTACPVCGERNKSTLSIGVSSDGAVLLKCFKSGCEPERITRALGLELADLFPERPAPGGGAPALKRRRMLSASQALEVLAFETNLVAVAVCNVAQGVTLSDDDRLRLLRAASRIQNIADEVKA
jgi:hypothetical protein